MAPFFTAALMLLACQEYTLDLETPEPGQGEAPSLQTPAKTDTIVQRVSPKVDILWVIDNSGSMREEQDAIALNMGNFLQYFIGSGLDWHIGVITTDTDNQAQNGKLRSVLGYRYVEPANLLSADLLPYMVQVGISGSGDERGLFAANNFFTTPSPQHVTANQGFYRDDAALHVIVISDENDLSSDVGLSRTEFINLLQTRKADPEIPVTFSSIVGPPGGCRGANGDAAHGSEYIAVTNAVGGIFQSICTEDWAPVLDQLGLLAASLRTEYFLTELPVPGTLEVVVTTRNKRWYGIDADALDGTLEDACEAADEAACFLFTYDTARNSVFTVDWRAPAASNVELTYELLSEFQPGLVDTDAP